MHSTSLRYLTPSRPSRYRCVPEVQNGPSHIAAATLRRVPYGPLCARFDGPQWSRPGNAASGTARILPTARLANHSGIFDAVVVWRFDRFARSVSHLLRALETFRALGIEFVSLSEQVDTSTPTGKMVFTVLGAVAELERSLIAERVKAGLRNARAKGTRLGRPKAAVDAATVADLRRTGTSWAKICAELGLSKGTAQRALWPLPKNPSLPTNPTA